MEYKIKEYNTNKIQKEYKKTKFTEKFDPFTNKYASNYVQLMTYSLI